MELYITQNLSRVSVSHIENMESYRAGNCTDSITIVRGEKHRDNGESDAIEHCGTTQSQPDCGNNDPCCLLCRQAPDTFFAVFRWHQQTESLHDSFVIKQNKNHVNKCEEPFYRDVHQEVQPWRQEQLCFLFKTASIRLPLRYFEIFSWLK